MSITLFFYYGIIFTFVILYRW